MGEPIETQADAGTVGPVLSYRTPAAVPPRPPARRTVAFRIAFGCWLVPLVFGSDIYILS